MDAGILSVVSSLINQDNVIAAGLFLLLYLIITKQRKSTAEVRDSENKKLTTEVDKLKDELNRVNTKQQLYDKELEYAKDQISKVFGATSDIKISLHNLELTMTQIATVVNTIAEKKLEIKVKEK